MSYKILKAGVVAFALVIMGGKAMAMEKSEKATFAGGCFWCMEHPFEKLDGVMEVISGYTGGEEVNPTYEEVSSGTTGHLEAVEITYDPSQVTYETLLDVFWRQINPTDPSGQFVDRGAQYRTAIFFHSVDQQKKAQSSKDALERSGRFKQAVVTEIIKAGAFYPAEDYHQDYYKKNSVRYTYYRYRSGRDDFLEEVWSADGGKIGSQLQHYRKPPANELKEKLSPLQFQVTQENATERAFANEYWDNKKEGIYVDIVSGEPLFSSSDKYKSGTGWPSFTKPLVKDNILEKEDRTLFTTRVEVRSRYADSHLGHVFADGPAPTGLRYCINSAALRFIPKDQLKESGYGEFLELFKND